MITGIGGQVMGFDSIKKLRLSPAEEQAYREWLDARERYRAECALFQRVRRQIPKDPREHTAIQIVLLVNAKQRYSDACKEYYKAQADYNAARSPLSGIPSDTQAIKDAISQFVESLTKIQPSMVQVGAQAEEQAALEARFGSIEQNPMLSAIAQVTWERQQKQDAPQLQKLLDLTDEIMDMDTPADALVATQAERAEARAATPAASVPEGEPEAEPDTPEALIQKYGIPEAPR
jgi:hypothetical protein